MHKLNQAGSLVVPLAISVAALLVAVSFGAWAYMGRQDYKNNTDEKIAEAVAAAEAALTLKKDAEFAEAEKLPFKSYQGPATYGSLNLSYPKNWSAYIDENGSGTILSGYVHPNFVPTTDSKVAYALRFEIVSTAYDQVLKTFDGASKSGKVKVSAYESPKVTGEVGALIDGEISSRQQGVLVLFRLRDKTIKVWTEGPEYRNDFNAVLQSLSFTP